VGGDLAQVLMVLPQVQKYQRIYQELDTFFEDWETLMYRAYKKVIPTIQSVRGESRVQRMLHSLKLRAISEQYRGVASQQETQGVVTPVENQIECMLEMLGGWDGLRNLICDVRELKEEISSFKGSQSLMEEFKMSIGGPGVLESKSRTTNLYSSTFASHN
jgi:hypothetical protein